ncbi:MAG: S41 family peptidase [Firmicutes bacterium]|nr:S41 family peptidase [Bacillota bacterium]
MLKRSRILAGGLFFLLLVGAATGMTFFFLRYRAIQETLEEFRPLTDAHRLVKEQYVREVVELDLLEGALGGMVDTLGDPYSEYLTQQRYRELEIQTQGMYGGIGVVLTILGEDLVILDPPLAGSPAAEANLREGDMIRSIDDVPVSEITFERAAELIRGPVGTEVVLGLEREGEEFTVTLRRDEIHLDTVRSQILGDTEGIGYLRVSMFNDYTGQELAGHMADLMEQGLQALIMDLRGNPGGILGAAVEVAEFFLPKGKPVLHVRARDGLEQTIYTGGSGHFEIPLVVLVDGGSASGAEIVAGALKDNDRAILVGTKTFGKGSVQSIYELKNGGGLKLTTALYITAGGHSIDKEGITPDVVVEYNEGAESDVQLEAAMEILQEGEDN